MIELFRQALLVQRFIEERDWEFCFIGGLALQRWGEPRATRAIDLTLFTDFGREMEFMDPLLAAFRPRIDDARDSRSSTTYCSCGLRRPPAWRWTWRSRGCHSKRR